MVLNLFSQPLYAEEYAEFDAAFLKGNAAAEKIDVSRFSHGNATPAGEYIVDVYLNNNPIGRLNTVFAEIPHQNTTGLCATDTLISAMDLREEVVNKDTSTDSACTFLTTLIPQAKTSFNMTDLRLDIEIPQALITQRPRDYISPSRWQFGNTTAFVRYDASHYRYKYDKYDSHQSYLSIDAGVNLFGWSIRHRGNKTWIPGFNTKYQNISTYAQHDIPALRAQLKLGDFYTSGTLMDSLSLRGVQLASDDRMLAPSLRGYAPTIRGVANSNARVTIRQKGVILREVTVPAGPFEIDDLYPTGYGGDLEVEVQEANGEKRTFSIPFTSTAQLVRPGFAKYSLSVGRYRDMSKLYNTKVAQATLQYGLTNDITLNLGATFAKNYHSELAGVSFNTPIGAFASNATFSHAKINRNTYKGYSLSINYNTRIEKTDTNVTLAAYRYSSRNYYGVTDVIYANEGYPVYDEYVRHYGLITPIGLRPKNQFQVYISQRLKDDWGYLYASGSTYAYWDTKEKQNQYQIGYSNSYKSINYSISFSQSKNNWGEKNTGVYLSLSIPLGKDNHMQLSQTLNHTREEGFASNTSFSHTLGENNQFSYGAYAGKQRHSTNFGVHANYTSSIARIGATWSHGNYRDTWGSSTNQQMSFNVSGAVVAHAKGITLANDIGDTFAIVHAKGAQGAKINGGVNNTIDYFGNGIVPYLEPYAVNYVGIDTSNIDDKVELSATNQEVIPRANQSVLVDFETKVGSVVFFEITGTDVLPPIGTEVFDDQGNAMGIVAQGGRIYTRAAADKGRLSMSWGDKQCTFNYTLPEQEDSSRPMIVPVQCDAPVSK